MGVGAATLRVCESSPNRCTSNSSKLTRCPRGKHAPLNTPSFASTWWAPPWVFLHLHHMFEFGWPQVIPPPPVCETEDEYRKNSRTFTISYDTNTIAMSYCSYSTSLLWYTSPGTSHSKPKWDAPKPALPATRDGEPDEDEQDDEPLPTSKETSNTSRGICQHTENPMSQRLVDLIGAHYLKRSQPNL